MNVNNIKVRNFDGPPFVDLSDDEPSATDKS